MYRPLKTYYTKFPMRLYLILAIIILLTIFLHKESKAEAFPHCLHKGPESSFSYDLHPTGAKVEVPLSHPQGQQYRSAFLRNHPNESPTGAFIYISSCHLDALARWLSWWTLDCAQSLEDLDHEIEFRFWEDVLHSQHTSTHGQVISTWLYGYRQNPSEQAHADISVDICLMMREQRSRLLRLWDQAAYCFFNKWVLTKEMPTLPEIPYSTFWGEIEDDVLLMEDRRCPFVLGE